MFSTDRWPQEPLCVEAFFSLIPKRWSHRQHSGTCAGGEQSVFFVLVARASGLLLLLVPLCVCRKGCPVWIGVWMSTGSCWRLGEAKRGGLTCSCPLTIHSDSSRKFNEVCDCITTISLKRTHSWATEDVLSSTVGCCKWPEFLRLWLRSPALLASRHVDGPAVRGTFHSLSAVTLCCALLTG